MMETINLIFGIIASIASIAAAVISFKNQQEIKSIKNALSNNTQQAEGKVAANVVGNSNSVGNNAAK